MSQLPLQNGPLPFSQFLFDGVHQQQVTLQHHGYQLLTEQFFCHTETVCQNVTANCIASKRYAMLPAERNQRSAGNRAYAILSSTS